MTDHGGVPRSEEGEDAGAGAYGRPATVSVYTPSVMSSVRQPPSPYGPLPPNAAVAAPSNFKGKGAEEEPAAGEEDRWNERFQEALASSSDDKFEQLSRLSEDFVSLAVIYSKMVVSEMDLPPERRTLKRAELGGIGGGDKYLVRGILIKVAQDKEVAPGVFLYGGAGGPAQEMANKAASHDLCGALHYGNALGGGVGVPIHALVDFNGYRLACMPWLPLSRLVYGSSDAGRTVHSGEADPEAAARMREAAERLHLAEHEACGKRLWSAGDVEAHLGADGRRYLLDLSRAFPPEAPSETPHLPRAPEARTVFARLLRPEFLAALKEAGRPPLSPDALSAWGGTGGEADLHNERVAAATRHLVAEVVPDYARDLDSIAPAAPGKAAPATAAASSNPRRHRLRQLAEPVSEELHARGINMRHAGLLRSHVRANEVARDALLVEVVSRTLKQMLRGSLRRGAGGASATRGRVVRFLNLVCAGPGDFWQGRVLPALDARFGRVSLTDEEAADLGGAAARVLARVLRALFAGTGVWPSATCEADLRARKTPVGFVFSLADIEGVSAAARYSSIVDRARGEVALRRAAAAGIGEQARARMLEQASGHFAAALKSDPFSPDLALGHAVAGALLADAEGLYHTADSRLLSAVRHLEGRGAAQAAAGLRRLYRLWAARPASAAPEVAARLRPAAGASSPDALAAATGLARRLGLGAELAPLLAARREALAAALEAVRAAVRRLADEGRWPAAAAGAFAGGDLLRETEAHDLGATAAAAAADGDGDGGVVSAGPLVRSASTEQALERRAELLRAETGFGGVSLLLNGGDEPRLTSSDAGEAAALEALFAAAPAELEALGLPLGAGESGAAASRKARSAPYPTYPRRFRVPDALCDWSREFPGYRPVEFTSSSVEALRDSRHDPVTGRPRNPSGRTGITGRGRLRAWGPNLAGDPVVLRRGRDGDGPLEVLAVRRSDVGLWGLPGCFLQRGSGGAGGPEVLAQLRRAVERKAVHAARMTPGEAARAAALLDSLFETATPVAGGGLVRIDDPRNTDNAWLESACVALVASPEVGRGLPLAPGPLRESHVDKAAWLPVDSLTDATFHANHRQLVRMALEAAELDRE